LKQAIVMKVSEMYSSHSELLNYWTSVRDCSWAETRSVKINV